MFKINKESGQAARLFLVLAIIVLLAILITYLVLKMASKPAAPVVKQKQTVPLPVYEKTLGNIKFVFESAIDYGNTLKASDAKNAIYSNQKDLTTTERYVQVTVGAENMGTNNTDQGAWDILNIVDSQGRKFVPEEGYIVNEWLPAINSCGILLKPAFDPVPCTKIYEISKASTGLKITIATGQDNNSANSFSSGKRDTFLLDLIVK
jgi:hypothetical protein